MQSLLNTKNHKNLQNISSSFQRQAFLSFLYICRAHKDKHDLLYKFIQNQKPKYFTIVTEDSGLSKDLTAPSLQIIEVPSNFCFKKKDSNLLLDL